MKAKGGKAVSGYGIRLAKPSVGSSRCAMETNAVSLRLHAEIESNLIANLGVEQFLRVFSREGNPCH